MNTKEALQTSMDMSLHVLMTYVDDLSDEELMQRPHQECNHLAWQLGHLISSEVRLLESIFPGKGAELPEGFEEKHSKETIGENDPAKFCTKDEYCDLYKKVREATLQALAEFPEEKLDDPSPEWIREMFPKVAHMFTLIGTHPMMHAGQFVVVRRELGKPIVI